MTSIMTQDTTTPEATAEVMALLDAADAAEFARAAARLAELDDPRAEAMASLRAAEVLNELRETEVQWGEDTRCTVCLCPLPAGATAYRDSDSVLCVDCAELELTAAGRTAR